MAILAKTGDLGVLRGEKVLRVVSRVWKSSRITDTLFPKAFIDFGHLLSAR